MSNSYEAIKVHRLNRPCLFILIFSFLSIIARNNQRLGTGAVPPVCTVTPLHNRFIFSSFLAHVEANLFSCAGETGQRVRRSESEILKRVRKSWPRSLCTRVY